MLIDLRQGGPELLQADVAIVGSGAAGNALARSLLARGLSIVLLESGGLDFEPDTADLNRGENVGQDYYDLERARLRFFGGTTAIWGGRCAEFDSIDLESRSWVPQSGWPFAMEELRPWVAAAREFLGLGDGKGRPPPQLLEKLSGENLAVKQWSFDRNFDRFGAAKNRDLIDHTRAQVAIHATVRDTRRTARRQCPPRRDEGEI